MATATSKEQAPAAPPAEKESKLIEFVPFGAKDAIQLSVAIVKRLVAVRTKTGKECSNDEAIKFMLMCQAKKLNPFEGDAFLIGYDTQDGPKFSLITAHQAFLKRAEVHQEFDGMESGVIVQRGGELLDLLGDWHMPNDVVLGGWATVFFKNRSHPMKKRLRLSRFNKGFGIWRDDPAGMIVKCAEADALRSSFPTMLGGMFIREESGDVITTEKIVHAAFPEETTTSSDAPAATPAPAAIAAPGPTTAEATPKSAAAPKKESKQPEKKASEPTLTRRRSSGATGAATTSTSEQTAQPPSEQTPPSDREKLRVLLSVGGATPEDFVACAIEEGWLDAEIGKWENIPEARFAEFVRPENFQIVTELLDARKAKLSSEPAPKPGQLL